MISSVVNKLSPGSLLRYYRIVNWGEKISAVRPIGYSLFGYVCVVQSLDYLVAFLNLVCVLGVLIFSYSLNDYYDYKLEGESNFLGYCIDSGAISERVAIALCIVPLVALTTLVWLPPVSMYLVLVFLGIVIVYSLPPIRLKDRGTLGVLAPVVCAPLLFAQGYFLSGEFYPSMVMMCCILLLFHFYIEGFHRIADGKKFALKVFPEMSILVSVVFSIFNPIFLITVLFSVVRLLCLRNINVVESIGRIRKDLLSPIWSLYEFALYAMVFIVLGASVWKM